MFHFFEKIKYVREANNIGLFLRYFLRKLQLVQVIIVRSWWLQNLKKLETQL